MKKIIYIAVVAVGFIAVSCSKENVQPTVQNTQEVPVWKSVGSSGATATDVSSDGSGAITDPNIDKDESARKKH